MSLAGGQMEFLTTEEQNESDNVEDKVTGWTKWTFESDKQGSWLGLEPEMITCERPGRRWGLSRCLVLQCWIWAGGNVTRSRRRPQPRRRLGRPAQVLKMMRRDLLQLRGLAQIVIIMKAWERIYVLLWARDCLAVRSLWRSYLVQVWSRRRSRCWSRRSRRSGGVSGPRGVLITMSRALVVPEGEAWGP
jgi:hypothetical protein